jgi:ABC-type transport system involved in multi-copper enzyme maturation permease subunit
MKRPPMVLSMKFRSIEGEGSRFGIWLPLFIIGPVALLLLLVLLLIVLPFVFLSFLFTMNTVWWRRLWYGIPAFFRLMHSLPGLNLDVENKKNTVYLDIR